MNRRAVILIVDDEVSNIEIMSAALEGNYEICFATSGEEALEVARSAMPDLVLLDIMMPGMDGYEVCRQLKQDNLLLDVPVIFTTGLGETEAEIKGLSVGAIDYVTKPIQPVILRARVANHVELKRLRDQLAELAMTDMLTGLGNRRRLEQGLAAEVSRLSRGGDWLSLIMLDIDFFKQFNDTYGHLDGDNCIRMVAAALGRAVKRQSDFCARYGGEEFACILPGTDHQGAMAVAREIRDHIARANIPHRNSRTGSIVTVSIGVATARVFYGMEPDFWVRNADRLLYHSKQTGRDRISGELLEPAPQPLPSR